MDEKKVLIEVRELEKKFPLSGKRVLTAVNGVNFDVMQGEVFGVVGESGCGKSTLGKVLLQLSDATSGSVIYHGKSINEISPKYLKKDLQNLVNNRDKAQALYQKAKADPGKAEKYLAEADALIENGARLIGSRILTADVTQYKELLEKAETEVNIAAAAVMKRRALKEIRDWNEIRIVSDPGNAEKYKKDNEDINKQMAALKAESIEHYDIETSYRNQIFGTERGEILPINDRCSDPEYIQYLDSLYNTGLDLCRLTAGEVRAIRHDMQMIFQDPAASLDPRESVGKAIEESLELNTKLSPQARKERTLNLLERVGLKREHYDLYPHNLSGGQKQRVGIARAVAMSPSFIVLDEAVSALDVSVKAQILKLLNELKAENDEMTYFFITHDLGIAKHFCDRIMVMYLGSICELAPGKELFNNPLHPYTGSLLSAVPRLKFGKEKKEAKILQGEVPSPIDLPAGCPFASRCDRCTEICRTEKPQYKEALPGHFVACHLYD